MELMQTVFGQPSWRVASNSVEGWVTRLGGHLGPVTFRLGNRNIQPFSVAPWAEESVGDQPGVLRALRGDFFCMPFGANAAAFEGEEHPYHGETANNEWSFGASDEGYLKLEMDTQIRRARVTKEIWAKPDETAIYCTHTITGGKGPMSLGHHAMVKFPSEGLLSVSPFGFGQVYPDQLEDPALGGYSSFKEGAQFHSLSSVPLANGGTADLSRYPARDGFEDLAMVYSLKETDFAWSAVVFPQEGYLWYALKDPRVLTGTILWHSNGGRHYAPWNGRHRAVMGIEDVTASMHYGLAGSVAENDASRNGYKTFLTLDASRDLVINYVMGVAEVPPDFGHVKEIHREDGQVVFASETGQRVTERIDHQHLSRTPQ
jgi:hypothetical protein